MSVETPTPDPPDCPNCEQRGGVHRVFLSADDLGGPIWGCGHCGWVFEIDPPDGEKENP